MSDQSSIGLSAQGPPETILPPLEPDLVAALAAAGAGDPATRRARTEAVAARWPRCLAAWADLADLAAEAGETIESYAFARVAYHRGLDALRGAGWRGSGFVRWRNEENRGFLRSLEALRRAAAAIGESDEAERCALFLRQLDPDWGHTH